MHLKMPSAKQRPLCPGGMGWRRVKMDAISRTTFSFAFPWMETLLLNYKYNFIVISFSVSNCFNGSISSDKAWRRTDDKPLSETMLACFTDAYMCHSATLSQSFHYKQITMFQLSPLFVIATNYIHIHNNSGGNVSNKDNPNEMNRTYRHISIDHSCEIKQSV